MGYSERRLPRFSPQIGTLLGFRPLYFDMHLLNTFLLTDRLLRIRLLRVAKYLGWNKLSFQATEQCVLYRIRTRFPSLNLHYVGTLYVLYVMVATPMVMTSIVYNVYNGVYRSKAGEHILRMRSRYFSISPILLVWAETA